MDVGKAESSDGVLAVLTHRNAPKLPGMEARISMLQNSNIEYNNQPIGVVVAETHEQAVHAASLVKVRYDFLPSKLDFQSGFVRGYPGSHIGEPGDLAFGNVEDGLRQAEVRIDQVYRTPIMHHNPMEPHATIAEWDGDRLTIHDTTQNISGHKEKLATIFGIPAENVRVVSLFLGGGFGCKGEVWSHTVIAAMAARYVRRPVKLVLDRPQMFGPVGARAQTFQHLTLGAKPDGKLIDTPRSAGAYVVRRRLSGIFRLSHSRHVRMSECVDDTSSRPTEPRHADICSRAGCRNRNVCDRSGNGRIGVCDSHGSCGSSSGELCRSGRAQ